MAGVNPALVDYGLDLSCRFRTQLLGFPDGSVREVTGCDLAAEMTEITGRPLLQEAIERRLITYRGTLIDDPNYGYDVTGNINDDVGGSALSAISGAVDAEAQKDERVLRSSTVGSFIGGALLLPMQLVDLAGPFRLTLSVSDLGVQVLVAR